MKTSWLSSFTTTSSGEMRNRAPTPEFPTVISDIPPQSPDGGTRTTPRLHRSNTVQEVRVRGRSATPDRASNQSPIMVPVSYATLNMSTIPPSPRSGRKLIKVIPDSPRMLRNRPPSPDESVYSDLSWLQHHSVWSERQAAAV